MKKNKIVNVSEYNGQFEARTVVSSPTRGRTLRSSSAATEVPDEGVLREKRRSKIFLQFANYLLRKQGKL
jgi:hypothetical protein